ncbi:Uncharacterized protein APZ42_000121 [Daphnia magna]|uniref:Uncharacterized protein n=1 Tax=Daphnia magna TaxID=35525 RepID=A0A164JWF5_9CRUS|nr:Uncharacterized protein APZ42_000121 [Daphnia magna]
MPVGEIFHSSIDIFIEGNGFGFSLSLSAEPPVSKYPGPRVHKSCKGGRLCYVGAGLKSTRLSPHRVPDDSDTPTFRSAVLLSRGFKPL